MYLSLQGTSLKYEELRGFQRGFKFESRQIIRRNR
jgi:hypothetical protein